YRYSGSTAIGVHTDDTHTLGFFCGNFDHGGDYLREKVYSVVILSDRVATPSEIEAYFACPYQLYESLEGDYHDEAKVVVTSGYADAVGHSYGVSAVSAIARAVRQAYGTSTATGAAAAKGQAVMPT